jgi:hypothetical protein
MDVKKVIFCQTIYFWWLKGLSEVENALSVGRVGLMAGACHKVRFWFILETMRRIVYESETSTS